MYTDKKTQDCSRGCGRVTNSSGETEIVYKPGCCKLSVFDWLRGIPEERIKDLFQVRFKNTRKAIYRNLSGQNLEVGDIVTVEAATGHDVGIVTLSGALIFNQLKRDNTDPENYEFKKIYRKAKPNDIEKWQEAISREHTTMIRSRQIAASLGLNMKIGDVEFQGDGTKAIFYYIADERVDFRQLIKIFAEEFRIRIEMKQIGARQEAGLIGGIGVCGQELCCAKYINDFQSITTQYARCQDLSLSPQKLAGQCSKLKCCINYEASAYIDAQASMPVVKDSLETTEGPIYMVKVDLLKCTMWFSFEQGNINNAFPLSFDKVNEILKQNSAGIQIANPAPSGEKSQEFKSAAGEGSISRFDENNKPRFQKKKKFRKYPKGGNENNKQ
ncbi:MAG: regulatory iron-sulfur-containing complex subunit RicT [Bacteroidales bacterium]|nr:hypothetical protein [Bacteroidales bacterium]MDD2424448.1 regulatory iron-sulfur-containing complex subunit RicT [Bacteroidales bacterium]MDD3989821.1 regulatory iron-sulfur-containing complex subunit RicT [Bacteroidales bacterium]MDD4639388.1 regulatory iron-sulfur-containing complex subunit RicT [Bacteroidales bacterium]